MYRDCARIAVESVCSPISPQGRCSQFPPIRFIDDSSFGKRRPELAAGYVYSFGGSLRVGFFTLDYILPIRIGEHSIVFGEAHSEWQDFRKKINWNADDQAYLSIGGGYRTILKKRTLLGVNGFYDSTRFNGRWYSSGGAGVEMAAILPGNDALDMNFNWYGKGLGNNVTPNDFVSGPSNYDIETGYSHQIFSGGPDLRLFAAAYKFDDGNGVYGQRTGVELKSPDGVVSAKYEAAYDRVNNSYQTISGFVNIGFQAENLLSGKSPFVMPEPIFKSPRNPARLTDTVKRHWRHATEGLFTNVQQKKTVTIVNKRSNPLTLYMGFKVGGWGTYTAKDFPDFSVYSGNPNILFRTVNPNEQVVVNFNHPNEEVSFALSADVVTWSNCAQTLAELTLFGYMNQDITDISLVNGFNYPMELASTLPSVQSIRVDHATGNQNTAGVFGLGCNSCTHIIPPIACTFSPPECHPKDDCQMWQPSGGNFVLSIMP
ncbi:MAG TPA: inverse autotransporter beta domain-containing protein [Desulfomonilaceae bacterium]|nr:inverse autotransporter beta domain-containing protein [Desulfomonilaceae bacterium]